jgi:hypothetical protein
VVEEEALWRGVGFGDGEPERVCVGLWVVITLGGGGGACGPHARTHDARFKI